MIENITPTYLADDSTKRKYVLHYRSNKTDSEGNPISPTTDNVKLGEIAINYNTDTERLYIKNDNGDIIPFISEKEVDKRIKENTPSTSSIKIDSVANVPIEYDFVVAEIENNETFGLSGIPEAGRKIDIFVKNPENGVCVVEFPSTFEMVGEETQMIVEYGTGSGLIHVYSDGEKVYIHPCGGMELPEPALPILFYDNTREIFVEVAAEDWNINDYPVDRYDPIGIVVIPEDHDVYKTRECGVLSLDYMDCENPETGTDDLDSIMYWGLNGVDTNSTYYEYLPICGTISDPTETLSAYTNTSPLAASDNFTGKQSPINTKLYFHDSEGDSNVTPPPILSDGTRCEIYNADFGQNNGFDDFNGKGNTENLANYATAQPNWQTDSTITDSSDAGYCPPICCCLRYHTNHTNPGDWYLPALGELGYVCAQVKAINNTIIDLNADYGKHWATITTVKQHWSSTQYSGTQVRTILMRTGGVNRINRTANHHARAFMRFKNS